MYLDVKENHINRIIEIHDRILDSKLFYNIYYMGSLNKLYNLYNQHQYDYILFKSCNLPFKMLYGGANAITTDENTSSPQASLQGLSKDFQQSREKVFNYMIDNHYHPVEGIFLAQLIDNELHVSDMIKLGTHDDCEQILKKANVYDRPTWRKFARETHPDKVKGREEEFKEVANCWNKSNEQNTLESDPSPLKSFITRAQEGRPVRIIGSDSMMVSTPQSIVPISSIDISLNLDPKSMSGILSEIIESTGTNSLDKVFAVVPENLQIKEDTHVCIFYKYQDPVVRMTCEYTIFVLKEIGYKLNEFNDLLSNGRDTDFDSACLSLFNSYSKKIEGSICRFGLGLVTCCSSEINKTISEFNYNLPSKLNTMLEDTEYKNLHNVSKKYPDFFNSERIKDIKLKIIQNLIKLIIGKSGRGEGILPDGVSRKDYPPISVYEVFDPTNDVWKKRCESYHLSRSPCVHAGIYGEEAGKKAIETFGLPDVYSSLIWIHTIAHALDRLYCGFTHDKPGTKVIRKNKEVWSDIMGSFKVFAALRKITHEKMYQEAFSEVFDTSYGYDETGSANAECTTIRRDGYACTRTTVTPQEEIKNFIIADDIINCVSTNNCLPFDQEYFKWIINRSQNRQQNRQQLLLLNTSSS